MTPDDRERRTACLAEAAAARTADAAARARRAITRMVNNGQAVTFVSVARNAGVSTSFLYQNTQIRDDITARRTANTAAATTRAGTSASLESLRTKLATASARNRELAEQVAQLRIENEALRSRLLGHQAQRRATAP